MLAGKSSVIHGNPQTVDLLEKALGQAKLGKLNFAAIIMCELPPPPGDVIVEIDFAGTREMAPNAMKALEILRNKIAADEINREPPEPDLALGFDHVSYNIAGAPVSWDFLPWLIDAEMTRIRHDAPAPLKIRFLSGVDGKVGLVSDYHSTMFVNVVRPLVQMLGAVETDAAARGRHDKFYTMRGITEAARAGEIVPKLKPSEEAAAMVAQAIAGVPPFVTITLREALHWQHRNSNLPEWLHFAEYLKSKGETVIFVRDTAKANELIPGFRTMPAASLDINIRLALYEQAKCNLSVTNGPTYLAWFGAKPWLTFVDVDADDPCDMNQPGWWMKFHGIEEGGQLPWSAPDQRLVWKSDAYENLCEAWEQSC